MHSSTEPAEPIPALPESAPDPYCGTPLGVEAAWCRNGFDVPRKFKQPLVIVQEALDFAGAGKAKATVATEPLENINQIFARMRAGDIDGRIVIDFQK